MGDLVEVRRRQIAERRSVFLAVSELKAECPKEVADYHEWHAMHGLTRQTELLDDPTPDRSWAQVKEIDRFIQNHRAAFPAAIETASCQRCAALAELLRRDKQSARQQ